ncbi:MAG TPA: hypothetical protein VIH89_04495 [Candidatus Sulfotelmatobacter sp.]|jgi:hypothetical protein
MPSSRVAALKREDISAAAKTFRSNRQLPKWSTIVDGRELPARPLVLAAAGVPPNDPTNSHQAVALLKERGFEVRYQGKTIQEEGEKETSPAIEELIRKLRGRYEGSRSLLEDREREHRIEKDHLSR